MSNDIQQILADLVKKFLDDKKITQTEFAEKYGCRQGYMNLMLNAKKPFVRQKLDTAIQSYNCTLFINMAIEDNEDISFVKNNISKLFAIYNNDETD